MLEAEAWTFKSNAPTVLQMLNRGFRGGVTLFVGLLFVAAGAEALGAFNACVANPACFPYASTMNPDGFFGILLVGILLAVAGSLVLVADLRIPPRF